MRTLANEDIYRHYRRPNFGQILLVYYTWKLYNTGNNIDENISKNEIVKCTTTKKKKKKKKEKKKEIKNENDLSRK